MTKTELISRITQQAKIARQAILQMTTLSGSGHPGGSMSSIDVILSIYNIMRHDPKNPSWAERDRMVFSAGHLTPAIYSSLGIMGYFPLEDAIAQFRTYGSIFEGHVEREVPGVEWSSGNLGQGLSAATGFAISAKIRGLDYHNYVLMGDGEQQKGQLSEARRFASKFHLTNLTAIIDYNQLQISGSIHDVMPQRIRQNWESDGWQVFEVNGHDVSQILTTLEEVKSQEKPVMILAHTTMGKGVSFMENKAKYHGSTLSIEQCQEALKELGMDFELPRYQKMRDEFKPQNQPAHIDFHPKFDLKPGKPVLYTSESDCRSAWGNAILDLGKINRESSNPIVVVDCDLAGSVKTAAFEAELPERFLQSGIMEHHTAVMSGAISTTGIQCFWAAFGVFGINEVYNMQRLNAINHTNLKTVVTHVGIDVGEDGKTHQCIDYISLARNLFDTRIICPADANQTDRVIRWLIDKPGNYFVTMGRSKLSIIKDSENEVFFDQDYCFEYGKADVLRTGEKGTVFVCGTPAGRAVKAIDTLREEGIFLELVYVSSPLALEANMISEAVRRGPIFSIEDHSIHGGLASSIAEAIVGGGHQARLIRIGIEAYPVSGTADQLYEAYQMDSASLIKRIKAAL
ncbi:MAG: transketolase [Candidatus Cloacimonadaceae bacterium]|nr:transketolase [Candidatus Cloacimonadota bacterium]MDY0128040.1 transketolase [Candidatus Cloacimonadaceae bacterium]MCB5255021.1 transketolase [Candidatus Cloacimonadota bacterium]MCK9178024.1 transketolase [Candidatus Cloacimonadota bacterium]MCK9241884.1 transketolase [Candidatus Cloacimonadota bacterium]